jgi:ABC-2 type transport system ATP-binding protein
MDHGRLITTDRPAAIKQSLPERCFEVRCADNRAARSIISAEPGVLSVDPSGASLHVFADPNRTSTASLNGALTRRKLGPVEVAEINPSLEDMFIALVRKEGRHAA